ncbi:MAG: LON peptidase substrate-binding domain-containing protein [Gemmatimonadota bacterium]
MFDDQPDPRFRLPLFPLPVVLLPGTPMPLHIFEPRYRDLVRDCLASDRRFGLVYHDWDRQGPFLCEEGRIGCVAEIREHEELSDGRSLITTQGIERFRIVDGIESESAYFEGLVTRYPDDPSVDEDTLTSRRRASIELFHAVVATLDPRPQRLPRLEPNRETSFLLAQTIGVDPSWHQQLLELRDERARLTELDRVFRAALE